MANYGAFIVEKNFLNKQELDLQIVESLKSSAQKTRTHDENSNYGNESRIHAVFEVKINNNIRKYLPHDIKSKIHTINFFFWGLAKFSQSLLINSWRDPKYFLAQMRLAFRHIYQFIKSYFQ